MSRPGYLFRAFIAIRLISTFACACIAWAASHAARFILVELPGAPLLLLPPFKAVAFRVLGALKPVYRESYRTQGLSLLSAGRQFT